MCMFTYFFHFVLKVTIHVLSQKAEKWFMYKKAQVVVIFLGNIRLYYTLVLLVSVSAFTPGPFCFDDDRFVLDFEIRWYNATAFFFFVYVAWSIWVSVGNVMSFQGD